MDENLQHTKGNPVAPLRGILSRILFGLRSGRRLKAVFFAKGVASGLVPGICFRIRRRALLDSIEGRPDADDIRARAAYCCRLDLGAPRTLPADAPALRDLRLPSRLHAYYFDARAATRYFPQDLHWLHIPGDVTHVPEAPSIVKSRPVGGDNANSVLLALNTVRHYVFAHDATPMRRKADRVCFRGKVPDKPLRIALFKRWFGAPGFDLGDTSEHPVCAEWARPKMTLGEQLRCKFILSVEGNDVASNLKWILSSNSVAVMPRPRFETCFEEGRLVPGVHFIEVRPDFSDLGDVLNRFAGRPDLCESISAAGRAWAARFQDPARERLVALLTLRRYFISTGQDPDAAAKRHATAEAAAANAGEQPR